MNAYHFLVYLDSMERRWISVRAEDILSAWTKLEKAVSRKFRDQVEIEKLVMARVPYAKRKEIPREGER